MNDTRLSNDTDASIPICRKPSSASLVYPVCHTTKTSNVFRHNSIYSDPQEKFYVEYAEGGSATRIKKETIDWGRTHKQEMSIRGRISGFSKKARNRLLWLLASLDKAQINPKEVLFATITYPGAYVIDKGKEIPVEDIDGKLYKKHLNHFITLLRQRHPEVFGVIRFEWQAREHSTGIPVGHYHLCLFGLRYLCRDWVAETWNRVVGGDADHLQAGTQVEPAKSWGATTEYFSKTMAYCGKEADELLDKDTGEMVHMRPIGKHWSYLNMKRMKDFIKFRVKELGSKEFYALRRQLFRLYRSVKRRKLISFDEDGYEYWESWKQRRWRKQKSKTKKWEQARIAQGGYLMAFFPNEMLRQLLSLFGKENDGWDFDERMEQGKEEKKSFLDWVKKSRK